MAKLCFDYGHGGKDSGATLGGRKESNDVLSIGKEIAVEMRRHGVTVDETRTNDTTLSLRDRSSFENNNAYDYFISFHRNAFNKKAHGVETFTYSKSSKKANELATKVQNNLVSLGFTDRGTKEANFHVLRETKAPAILVEMGFIDNVEDNKLFDSKRNEIVKAITQAILSQLNIEYVDKIVIAKEVDKNTNVKLYKVQVGAFGIRSNADNLVLELEKLGYKPFIDIE